MNKDIWMLKCIETLYLEGFSTPDFISGKFYRVKTKIGDTWEIVGEFGLHWINIEAVFTKFEEVN